MPDMTPLDTTAARLEALLERATRGNWFVDGLPHNQIIWSDAENRVCFMCHSNGIDEQRDIATGELIPAMKNALPALLLERRALKAEVARLRQAEQERAVMLGFCLSLESHLQAGCPNKNGEGDSLRKMLKTIVAFAKELPLTALTANGGEHD